jgi:dimethylaniline monooxygenase (N-oxide forming)
VPRPVRELTIRQSHFTDFPYPDDFPVHPGAADLSRYYCSYAKHFGIYDRITFNVTVASIRKSSDGYRWMVHLEGEPQPRTFDKVVLATGTEALPKMPQIEGMDKFEGKFIHGQAYKRHVHILSVSLPALCVGGCPALSLPVSPPRLADPC